MTRLGYTTGTAAAAAAKAAAMMLATKSKVKKVSIETPGGLTFTLRVFDQRIGEREASCCVVKDAGDDPDVTNGIKIYAKVREGKNGLIIKGGEGIGIVTKPGLSLPVGAPAINPVPLKMIKHEVEKVMPSGKGLEITISAPEGRERAKKTFNPRLGIQGGISIIGTTGIVRPMSETSWKTSLFLQLDVALASGFKTLVLTPGHIGEKMARERFRISQEMIVHMGNWVGDMLDACVASRVKKVILVGHIGKLIKLTADYFDTRKARGKSPQLISRLILSLGYRELAESTALCNTAEEAVLKIKESDPGLLNQIAKVVREKAEAKVKNRLTIGVILISLSGEAVGLEEMASSILAEIGSGV